MTLARNGFTLSGRFMAKTAMGNCPQCSAGFTVGDPSTFLRSHMGADGLADRPLTQEEARTHSDLTRSAQGIAHSRGILPRTTRNGRRARRQRPASLAEVGTQPDWMFDHMIHWTCRPEFAGNEAARDIGGHRGTRTTGLAHGSAVGASELTEADRAAARTAGVRAREINARATAPTGDIAQGPAERPRAIEAVEAGVNAEVMTAEEQAAALPPVASYTARWAATPEARADQAKAREGREQAAREREAQAAREARATDLARVEALAKAGELDAGAARFALLDLD